ncbi:MAG: hypothetical protein GC178_16955 [Flavobacteriales bacterium]|nr:hypothetical protein [Flavobacteriales bacterium]
MKVQATKMKGSMVLALILFLASCVNSTQETGTESENSVFNKSCPEIQLVESLLQSSLDYEELQHYFHFEELPERIPLTITQSESIPKGITLEKGGEKVEFTSKNNQKAIAFTKVLIEQNTAEVSFNYPPEGIIVELYFNKTDCSWELEKGQIKEQ